LKPPALRNVRAREGSAFLKLAVRDLELVLSVQVERTVRNDNVVVFEHLLLQLSQPRTRAHYVRCPVFVHRFLDATLGVSFHGRLISRFDAKGGPLPLRSPTTVAA
jgi:hypothetical protein